MSRCATCGDLTHVEFRVGGSRCNGCEQAPARCICQPAHVPEWVRRAREHRLASKDMTGAAA